MFFGSKLIYMLAKVANWLGFLLYLWFSIHPKIDVSSIT